MAMRFSTCSGSGLGVQRLVRQVGSLGFAKQIGTNPADAMLRGMAAQLSVSEEDRPAIWAS